MSNHATPKPPTTLRILHTADWHLGKRLINEQRYEEFGEFLAWLIDTIAHHQVDVLVVAGDVFDTMTPSNKAQELYYQFLGRLSATTCRHAIIVAGNHDSPSFLDAPKTLFRHFNIQVVGAVGELADELFVLDDTDGNPALIVAAVPYLRERDTRNSEFGDSLEQRQNDTVLGIKAHYQHLAALCKDEQNGLFDQIGKRLPMMATGHLFATGASVAAQDDGMRELYVGTLGQIGAEIFAGFDYVALGHIHREQMVGKQPHIRYSGSPMAMGFGECKQTKKVLLVDFHQDSTPITPVITPIEVPVFRRLVAICGDWHTIENEIITLKHTIAQTANRQKSIWLTIDYTDTTIIHNLQEKIADLIGDSPILAIQIKQKSTPNYRQLGSVAPKKSLEELTPNEVFLQLLDGASFGNDDKKKEQLIIDDEQKNQLIAIYSELLNQITHEDIRAV